MCIQVWCAPEFHNDFWKKYFISRIILQEFIIAFLFVIKAILNPFYLPCIVRREYFSIIFNVKSVHYT